MKASQKFIIIIENITLRVRFDDMDKKLLPLIQELEKTGDILGPVVSTVEYNGGLLFVSVQYEDKRRGPVKPSIFGIDSEVFLAKQYK